MHSFGQHLEFESCGCSFRSLGGVDRMKVALRKARETNLDKTSRLFLASGPSFTYWGERLRRSDAERKRDSEKLVEHWNSTELDALFVSSEDLTWGVEALKALETRSKFRWISANIVSATTGNRIFSPSMEWRKDGANMLISSVAHPGGKLPADVRIADPIKSLESLVRASNPRPDILVVLTSYSTPAERETLQRNLTIPHVILYGDDMDSMNGPAGQYGYNSVFMRSLNRGRSLSHLTLHAASPTKEFFHPEIVLRAMESILPLSSSLENLKHSLRSIKSKQEREKTSRQIKDIQDMLVRAQVMPTHTTENSTIYEYNLIPIDQRFDQK